MGASFREARDRLVLPLDVAELDEAQRLIELLKDDVGVFKVGLELFTAHGPRAVELVREAGARCFLDLKLFDIPATMAGAVGSAIDLGVDYLTLHASAGPTALARCAELAEGTRTRLLAVTVLTSMDEEELRALGHRETPRERVVSLAHLAYESGLRGFVCSPEECAPLREALGPSPVLMVPGVRPEGADKGDQRRVATPTSAISSGASLLVVGRPIRRAADPRAAAQAIVREIEDALGAG